MHSATGGKEDLDSIQGRRFEEPSQLGPRLPEPRGFTDLILDDGQDNFLDWWVNNLGD